MRAGEFRFTVVIPTYNRWQLLPKALESVRNQASPGVEILVVDDASTQPMPASLPVLFPEVRYLRQSENLGPGAARNRGLAEAASPWVLMLDDDDWLFPEALSRIATLISELSDKGLHPVYQFAHENGQLEGCFRRVTLCDYLKGGIRGDFIPVFHRDTFNALGLRYPGLRIGAEHLLWWNLARERGIPTWSERLAGFGVSPRKQLTSWRNQVEHAAEYAAMQEQCLNQFGTYLERNAPEIADKKSAGAAVYWLLSGRPDRARLHLHNLYQRRKTLSFLVWTLSWMPVPVIRTSFGAFRTLARI